MFSINRFLAVAKKEYLELRRNPLLFIVLMLGPIMVFLLHAYGMPLDLKNISLGVLDMDKSPLSRGLLDTFQNSNMFNIKSTANDIKTLQRQMDLADLRAVVIIPHGFSLKLKRNMPIAIQAMVDGTYPNQALISAGYIEAAVNHFNLNQWAAASAQPINLNVSVWHNSTFNGDYFLVPGLFGLTLVFFPAIMAALSLVKEKETRSILNFYCSNVNKTEYLVGKMFPYILIAFIQCLICFGFAVLIMNVPMRGSLLAFILASLLFSIAAVGTGLLIAVFINSQAAAILFTAIFTLTFTFTYSGIITPVMCLSEDNRNISNLLPVTHFIDIARRVMIRGADFYQVRNGLIMLFISCVVLYGVSILIFKKRLD